MSTPALARATDEVVEVVASVPGHVSQRLAQRIATRAVSAALHDPDDPDFGAKAIHARDVQNEVTTCTWDELQEHAREGYREDFDAVRAAILGGA